jgi:predicted DNA-binding transcriptional regulator AlpA
MTNLTSEFLAAAMMADPRRRKAALRVLSGDIPLSNDSEHPILLKSGPASKLLGVSKATFWRLVQQGRLKPVQITTKATFFRRCDILALAGEGGAS